MYFDPISQHNMFKSEFHSNLNALFIDTQDICIYAFLSSIFIYTSFYQNKIYFFHLDYQSANAHYGTGESAVQRFS